MEFPKTKAQLQSYGRLYIEKERKKCLEHWTRRIAHEVLECARLNKSHYRFVSIDFSDSPLEIFSVNYVPSSILQSLLSELKRYFPDSNIYMDDKVLVIDWS